MSWLFRLLSSTVGKKVQMALTGLLLCGFLVAHLGGNLFVYQGREAYNHYAKALEGNPLLPLAELALAALFLLHIATGLWVSYESRKARPVPYVEVTPAGGKTLGSATMVYSGILLGVFLAVHVRTFRFAPDRSDLFQLVLGAFRSKAYALFYIVSMGALALHLSHGFQSGFQTLGVSHPRYTPLIQRAGLAFAAAVALGFASIPFWAGFF